MAIFKGKNVTVEIFGESHSDFIGAKVSGFPKTVVDGEKLSEFMQTRRASGGVFSTSRIEEDKPIFTGTDKNTVSGDFSFVIKNGNVKSKDYSPLYGKPRPSHADYAWYLKDGALDFSGGGRFSGRLTAALCVVGGICKQYLKTKGIDILAYVAQTGSIIGKSYKTNNFSFNEGLNMREGVYPSLDKKEEMIAEIAARKSDCDSVGGKIECVVYGMPVGVGDNLFGGLESKISSLVYAVPAVKGVEFGLGFGFSRSYGKEVNDQLFYENGEVKFFSNNSGGINGGISNGANLTLGVALRPTPSISAEEKTVDLVNKKNCVIKIEGRHDACIVPRAVPCIESAVAIALTDELSGE